ncbi:CoA transferase subunit A [Fusibacter ferrireducens]|uniref:CoA transferase subunit A n=1 Tax=Fusibacter ferrireducens TaxID=2785058 RepID=A0ABR9ZWQ7_9FIRM|nr:CoA transferase subunit A [Fusibacter ferrireducens]MBF4694381.1 CoA transferase subunit A [Fusibacter ferrireducens]
MNKVRSLDDVINQVKDGMTIMIGGFLGVGSPLQCLEKLSEKNVKDLTVIAIVNSYPGGNFDLAPLFKQKQIRKFITAHSGTCPEAIQAYKNGEVEIEYYPMGTLIEKIRAGGAGLGAVVTPIGVDTLVEKGKEKITIDGKPYLIELPLRADIAFIKGFRADTLGNIQYRGIAINSNPVMASAADYTVAEVNEIVELGSIDPERVGTPCIFVNAVVEGYPIAEQQALYRELWIKSGYLHPKAE